MKKLLIALFLCVLGIGAKAQVISNATACKISVQQVCISVNPCTRIPGPTVGVLPSTIIPNPFVPCAAGQETIYIVCWGPCPGLCTVVSATPPPTLCSPWPTASQLPPCPPCGPAQVIFDLTTGNLKVF